MEDLASSLSEALGWPVSDLRRLSEGASRDTTSVASGIARANRATSSKVAITTTFHVRASAGARAPKPNRDRAMLRIWISSEPSVIR